MLSDLNANWPVWLFLGSLERIWLLGVRRVNRINRWLQGRIVRARSSRLFFKWYCFISIGGNPFVSILRGTRPIANCGRLNKMRGTRDLEFFFSFCVSAISLFFLVPSQRVQHVECITRIIVVQPVSANARVKERNSSVPHKTSRIFEKY